MIIITVKVCNVYFNNTCDLTTSIVAVAFGAVMYLIIKYYKLLQGVVLPLYFCL